MPEELSPNSNDQAKKHYDDFKAAVDARRHAEVEVIQSQRAREYGEQLIGRQDNAFNSRAYQPRINDASDAFQDAWRLEDKALSAAHDHKEKHLDKYIEQARADTETGISEKIEGSEFGSTLEDIDNLPEAGPNRENN